MVVGTVVGIGGILHTLVYRAMGIAERGLAYVYATKVVLPEYEKLSLSQLMREFMTKQEYERVKPVLENSQGFRQAEAFIDFLKRFNLTLARHSLKVTIVSPEGGRMVSQLLNAISWSYGFGWLSWIAMGPILQTIIANRTRQDLEAFYSPKLLSKSEMEKLFIAGKISESDYRDYLKAQGYSKEQADLDIIYLREIKFEKEKDLTKSDIYNAYILDEITRANAKQMLMALGYDEREAELLLKLWDYRKEQVKRREEQKGKKIRKSKERELTKADILNAYKRNLLSAEEAYKRLRNLGYDDEEAKILIAIASQAKR